jgi:uncharacterized protein (TIGR03437 family)
MEQNWRLPVSFNGTTVSVQDASGVLRLAQLFYVGPEQVNFVVPGATGNGSATVTVASSSGASATANVNVSSVAPALFAMPGGSAAAASAVRANPAGAQTPVAVFQCSGASACSPTPIDMGGEGDIVVVTFFGTGLRNNSSLANVKASIGGVDSPVVFAGAQGQFVGLDQANVQVPLSLRGRGELPVVFTIDGQTSNTVRINLR